MSGKPPEFENVDNCRGCKASFTLFVRKHHCRRCGKTYCGECSSKTAPIPEFGLSNSRVCEACFIILTTKGKEETIKAKPEGEDFIGDHEKKKTPPRQYRCQRRPRRPVPAIPQPRSKNRKSEKSRIVCAMLLCVFALISWKRRARQHMPRPLALRPRRRHQRRT